jgi:hypothetical protein
MEIFRKKFLEKIDAEGFNLTDIISYDHNQDCCEKVYIDFEHIDLHRRDIVNLKQISEISIKGVEGE